MQQVKPGQYERPFDTLELFYRGISEIGARFQKEQYFISSAMQLKKVPPVTQIRQAWIALRHQHPKIAAVPDETCSRLVYTVPSSEDLEEWIQKTFVVHEDETRVAESLDPVLPPSSLMMLHYLPHSKELFFRTPHWRIDGAGLILLENDFLTLLANSSQAAPEFDGSEVSRIPPTLDEALDISLQTTEETKQATQAELSVVAIGATPASVTQSLPNTTPGNSHRLNTRFSKDFSQRLIAASKSRGLSVTAAVQTALILAAQSYMAPADGRLVCSNA